MPLARPGDPYVANDGKVLAKKSEFNAFPMEEPHVGPPKAISHQSKQRRSMPDLPAEPKLQTAIIVVLNYSLFGLSDNEIAHAIGHSMDDVRKLKEHPAYQETFELLFHEMINSNSSSMLARIHKFAPKALQNLFNLADSAENDHARLKANESILDRSGLHFETLHGKATSESLDGLKIVIQDGDDAKPRNIDIEIKKR